MLRHLGATGDSDGPGLRTHPRPGSTAFRQALHRCCQRLDRCFTRVGVDKPGLVAIGPGEGTDARSCRLSRGAVHALRAAHAGVHGALRREPRNRLRKSAVQEQSQRREHPYAQRQKAVTLDEVMAGPAISGSLTRLQCCPVGEGAGRSDRRLRRCDLRNLGSIAIARLESSRRSLNPERVYREAKNFDAEADARNGRRGVQRRRHRSRRSRSPGTFMTRHD